jgi:hypothetical protein
VGEVYIRVIECKRRERQRDRELAVLEGYHAQKYPRPAGEAGSQR